MDDSGWFFICLYLRSFHESTRFWCNSLIEVKMQRLSFCIHFGNCICCMVGYTACISKMQIFTVLFFFLISYFTEQSITWKIQFDFFSPVFSFKLWTHTARERKKIQRLLSFVSSPNLSLTRLSLTSTLNYNNLFFFSNCVFIAIVLQYFTMQKCPTASDWFNTRTNQMKMNKTLLFLCINFYSLSRYSVSFCSDRKHLTLCIVSKSTE